MVVLYSYSAVNYYYAADGAVCIYRKPEISAILDAACVHLHLIVVRHARLCHSSLDCGVIVLTSYDKRQTSEAICHNTEFGGF